MKFSDLILMTQRTQRVESSEDHPKPPTGPSAVSSRTYAVRHFGAKPISSWYQNPYSGRQSLQSKMPEHKAKEYVDHLKEHGYRPVKAEDENTESYKHPKGGKIDVAKSSESENRYITHWGTMKKKK